MLDNKYRVIKPLGIGGEGSVWLAVNIRTYKAWAVKEISKGQREEAGLWRRFENEHLLQIVDIIDENKKTYLVMEYIKGMTLEQLLQKNGRFSLHRTAECGIQICEALIYLHTRNPAIIHGDVKPANIICRENGTLVLLDYGSLTRSGAINTDCFGTKAYAAPEQFVRDRALDARTDIYSLGATMYQLFTGEICRKSNSGMIRLPGRRLRRILKKCMEECPDLRYASGSEVLKRLEGIGRLRRVCCILIAVAAGVCLAVGNMIPMRGRVEEIREKTYDELVAEGGEENFKKAIVSDDGRLEAYLKLLELFLEDGSFSVGEEQKIWEALTVTEESREKIPAIGEFEYQLGLAYWYYYEDNGGKKYALPWFEKAAHAPEDAIEPAHRLRARVFLRIGGYYEKLGQKDISGDKNQIYNKYWVDLMELKDSNIAAIDNNVTQLRLMDEIVTQIYVHCALFKNGNVTELQMVKVLEEIKSELKEMEISEREDSVEPQLCSRINDNISLAEESIERTFLRKEE